MAVVAAIEAWLRAAPGDIVLVVNLDDPGGAEVLSRLADWPGRAVAYALLDQASQRLGGYARGIAERYPTTGGPTTAVLGRLVAGEPVTTLEIHGLDPLQGAVRVRLPAIGRHDVASALGVAAAAHVLGLPPASIVVGLGSFTGLGRQLDDPPIVDGTIPAVRGREPGRRVWAVYEPLAYHRMAALLEPFARASAERRAGRDREPTTAAVAGLASVVAVATWHSADILAGDVVLVIDGGRRQRPRDLLLE